MSERLLGVLQGRHAKLFLTILFLCPPLIFLLAGTPHGHSYPYNMSWFIEVDAQISQGYFPPRHLPGLWGGLGGLDMFYYGPLPFWFAAVVRQVFCWSCSPETAFALAGGFALSLSALSFYVFARRFTQALPAISGSIVFALMPYHLFFDWTWRQAVGEFYAYIFLPLIAAGMHIVLTEKRISSFLILSFTALCMTHLPTALLAEHIFFVIFLAWAWGNRSKPAEISYAFIRLSVSVSIGALLSAWVWLPAIAMLGSVSSQVLFNGYFQAHNWLIGFFNNVEDASIVPMVILSFLIVVLFLRRLHALPKGGLSQETKIWTLVPFITCVVLISEVSFPIWKYWIISSVQFPWRLLSFCDLVAGLAVALIAQAVVIGQTKKIFLAYTFGVMLFLNIIPLFLHPNTDYWVENPNSKSLRIGAVEYIPPHMFATFVNRTGDEDNVFWAAQILGQDYLERTRTTTYGYDEFSLLPRYAVAIPKPGASEVLLPLPYWSFWAAESGGASLETSPDPDFGLTYIRSSNGEFVEPITLTLPWFWSEKIGAILSVIAALAFSILVFLQTKRAS